MRVIKVGGRPQLDPALPVALARAFRDAPGTLVVVHGGGEEIGALQRLYGVESRFVEGRRVTAALDLEIIRMALSGAANKRLVSGLVGAGVPAVGVSGEDAGMIRATPIDVVRYGHAGLPSRVEAALLHLLLRGSFLPVVSPVSRGEEREGSVTLNVNGDDAAAALAAALAADELLLVSDVEGVRVDGETVRDLGVDEADALIASGEAAGGMGAKLQAGMRALDGGVGQVRISDIAAIGTPGRGTVLTRVGSGRT